MTAGPRPRPELARSLELRLRELIDQRTDERDRARLAQAVYRRRLNAMRKSRDLWRHRALQR